MLTNAQRRVVAEFVADERCESAGGADASVRRGHAGGDRVDDDCDSSPAPSGLAIRPTREVGRGRLLTAATAANEETKS